MVLLHTFPSALFTLDILTLLCTFSACLLWGLLWFTRFPLTFLLPLGSHTRGFFATTTRFLHTLFLYAFDYLMEFCLPGCFRR